MQRADSLKWGEIRPDPPCDIQSKASVGMYAENELLFPPYAIPFLRNERGPEWSELVDRVAQLPEDHPESLAFSLMMMRLDGCLACETDSYRAMRGCKACASQVLRRHKGADTDLLQRYERALRDVRAYLAANPMAVSADEVIPARAA